MTSLRNNEAQRRSSFTMQEQKDTPLEETLEATDSQHGARDLKDRDGNEDAASPQMRDRYVVSTTFGPLTELTDPVSRHLTTRY